MADASDGVASPTSLSTELRARVRDGLCRSLERFLGSADAAEVSERLEASALRVGGEKEYRTVARNTLILVSVPSAGVDCVRNGRIVAALRSKALQPETLVAAVAAYRVAELHEQLQAADESAIGVHVGTLNLSPPALHAVVTCMTAHDVTALARCSSACRTALSTSIVWRSLLERDFRCSASHPDGERLASAVRVCEPAPDATSAVPVEPPMDSVPPAIVQSDFSGIPVLPPPTGTSLTCCVSLPTRRKRPRTQCDDGLSGEVVESEAPSPMPEKSGDRRGDAVRWWDALAACTHAVARTHTHGQCSPRCGISLRRPGETPNRAYQRLFNELVQSAQSALAPRAACPACGARAADTHTLTRAMAIVRMLVCRACHHWVHLETLVPDLPRLDWLSGE